MVLVLPMVCACDTAPSQPGSVTRTDSAGIELVVNSGPDHLLSWSMDSVFDLRSPTGTGGDTVGFLNITDVATTGDRIVVLDRSVPALFVYDSLGHVQGRYGRKGHGPGEFEHPTAVATAPRGGVGVFDVSNRRIELFDTSFAPAGSILLGTVRARGAAMRFAGDPAVLTTFQGGRDTPVDGVSAIGPRDTTVIATLRRPVGKAMELKSCGWWQPAWAVTPLFWPELRWTTDRRGDVLLAKGDRYDIGVYGGPRFTLTRRIRRDQPIIQATKELAVKSLGEGMKMLVDGVTRVCDPEEQVEKQGFGTMVPPLGAMIIAPDGDIWVERWVLAEEASLIDIFDSSGVYRGTMKGEPMPDAFLGNDRVIVKRTGALDVDFLTIYRVVQ